MVPWLEPYPVAFPLIETALDEPNGLLAAGGALTPEWLLHSYKQGVFPWFSDDDPILWWSPAPRSILYPQDFHLSRSLKKSFKKERANIRFDTEFEQVIRACSEPRDAQDGTWITEDMIEAYCHMHDLGHAHCVEVWDGNTLAGGLYGLQIGRMFFGESMFSRRTNASKIAAFTLCRHQQAWQGIIDCQVDNPHLASLGAKEIPRADFQSVLKQHIDHPTPKWTFDASLLAPEWTSAN